MNYNVGDSVRIVDNVGGHGFETGDIITLIQRDEEDEWVYLARLTQSNSSRDITYYVEESEFEKTYDDDDENLYEG